MEISNEELRARARKIKYFFTDVDGTLTDGCVYYSHEGELLKKFSLRDGTGFFLLHQVGIKTGIITGEDSPIVQRRAEKLKVDKLIMNAVPKVEKLEVFLKDEKLDFENVAYIGDSINDVKLLQSAGISFAVGDADEFTRKNAMVLCENQGGKGAFLEAAFMLTSLLDVDMDSIIQRNL